MSVCLCETHCVCCKINPWVFLCLCCVHVCCADHVFEFAMAIPRVDVSVFDIVCVCVCVCVMPYVDACKEKTMGVCVCFCMCVMWGPLL